MADRAKDQPRWKDRRSCPRRLVLWSGRLHAGTQDHEGIFLDLSASGAMLRLTEPVAVPAGVTVSAERFGTLHGRVVWQRQNVVGLRFSETPRQVARAVGDSAPGLRLAG